MSGHPTIAVHQASPSQRRPRPTDDSALGFGAIFTDHMFLMDYQDGKGWINPRIEPYGPLSLDPATLVLHYCQEVFEGLKAYRRADGGIQLFRPRDNFRRMNVSNERLCMPALDVEFALEALKELIRLDADWVPRSKGTSLYIRPNIIATGVSLGVKVSPSYLYYVILSPVGAYYKGGFAPTRILVSDDQARSVAGGVGAAKTGGNYAASLKASEIAHEQGYSQVLWLDGATKSLIEEVGTSNFFVVLDDTLVTAPLGGTILPGITRDSVIAIARGWGMKVEERPLRLAEVLDGMQSGRLTEAFATGTAAVISPVGELGWKGRAHAIGGGGVGALSLRLHEELTGIQWGERPDTRGWIEKV